MTGFRATTLRRAFRRSVLTFCILLLFDNGAIQARESISTRNAPGETSKNRLIGVWESPDTTRGGLGAIYEFREDGGWMKGIGALVDGSFDPQDPLLQQFMQQPDEKSPDETGPGGNEHIPQKISDGPAGSPSYVGVWKYLHYTGGFAFMRIMPNGRYMLRVPFPLLWGKYEVKGKKLRLIEKGCPPVDAVYTVTDTTLEITSPGKKKIRLRRVQPIWYHALTESEAEGARMRLQQNFPKDGQDGHSDQREGDKGYEILR